MKTTYFYGKIEGEFDREMSEDEIQQELEEALDGLPVEVYGIKSRE